MKISTSLHAILNSQAEHERFASASYLALAHWCNDQDYSGFASFFHAQAEEEIEHMLKLQTHLLDRGVCPKLEALPAPVTTFSSLTLAAQHALALEEENTKGIETAYAAAIETNDYAAQVLLQWFITEQVEEEAWAHKMVTLCKRAECSGAIYSLDRHISKDLSENDA
ncbi:ferritin [Kiritimatiellota bacterium B12222]|nr:ferritin [Kiritimatiellota bacterium B12222]